MLRKTPKGAPSTAEEVLAELALDYPLPAVLMEYRSLSKLKSTYTDKLPEMIDSANRAGSHLLSSGGDGHRALVVLRPEPAEHSDSY